MSCPPPVTPGQAWMALAYRDARRLRNRVVSVVRTPRRLIVWLALVAWLGLTVIARIHARAASPSPLPAVMGLLVHLIPQATFIALGLVALTSARRAPWLLGSPADGHFLLDSALPRWTVLLWLELGQVGRWVRVWIFLGIVWGVTGVLHLTAASAAQGLYALVMATALLSGLRLPVFALGRRTTPSAVSVLALALIALGGLGLAPVVAGAWRMGLRASIVAHSWPLPPGTWILGSARGHAVAMALLLCTVLVVNVAGALLGVASLPEVYESSTRAFARRRLRPRGIAFAPVEGPPTSPRARTRAVTATAGLRVPGGAWTLLWKEWLTLIRARGEPSFMIAVLLVAALAGVGGALILRTAPRGLLGAIVGTLAYAAVIMNLVSGASLAADLRKPSWWLSAASLRARLSVWTLATSLKTAVPLGLAATILGAMRGRVALALAAWPLVILAMFVLRSATLFTYAIVPAPADMRGPGRLIRLAVVVVLLGPTVGAGVAVFGPFGLADAIIVAATVSLVQALGLVHFTARLLAGNGLAVAREEH